MLHSLLTLCTLCHTHCQHSVLYVTLTANTIQTLQGDEATLLHVRDYWATQDSFKLWVLAKGECEQAIADRLFTIRVSQ